MATLLPEDPRYKAWENVASQLGALAGEATVRTVNLPLESRYTVKYTDRGPVMEEIAPPTSRFDVFMSQLFPGLYPEATEWSRMGMPEQVAREQLEVKYQENLAMGILTDYLAGKITDEEVLSRMNTLDPTYKQKYFPLYILMKFSGLGEPGKKDKEKSKTEKKTEDSTGKK